ncbi:Mitochondrial inner membrane protein OXA1L [Psilocybe cubensis]|uniref:Membrane insertase YidC/Oxa/ALB C-terminal domain-containing protein n=2 Tax=Psilocybe cubensis TaxID=181762 RepID=A0A8H8CF86_PSICU|nr:Mitochondrial inner membrane protein OXA1L [Psilocybe cubensis]KAH9477101.1 Mitochondrial inner membrane protein OXA1L [Psilocybe cubensis]
MAFAASVGLGIRSGTLRTCSKSLKSSSVRLTRSDARLFSSLLQASGSSCRSLNNIQTPSSRNLSLWGSSSKSTPPPSAAPEAPPATEETAAAVAESSSTPATSAATTPLPTDAATDATTSLPTEVVTEAAASADVPTTLLTDVTEAIATHAPAALQYGDLAAMGLAGWSPAGLVRWSLELINVSTGMPWFWTIIAGSAFWRLVCVPFAIKGLQASARMQPHQTKMLALQQEIKRTAEKKDPVAMKLATVKMQEFYRANNINPLGGVIALVQMPITLGIFFGVQKLCKLPLEQLHYSGVSFLPDLTVADPTYIMPLALCALINVQIMVGARDLNTKERPDMAHIMNLFRVMTIPGIAFMAAFPSGLLLSLMTTAILTTAQTLIMRMPVVRNKLQIPIVPPSAYGKLPTIRETFTRGKNWFKGDLSARMEKARKEALARQNAARRPPMGF